MHCRVSQLTFQSQIQRSIHSSAICGQLKGQILNPREAFPDEGDEEAGITRDPQQLHHLLVAEEVEARELIARFIQDVLQILQYLLLGNDTFEQNF